MSKPRTFDESLENLLSSLEESDDKFYELARENMSLKDRVAELEQEVQQLRATQDNYEICKVVLKKTRKESREKSERIKQLKQSNDHISAEYKALKETKPKLVFFRYPEEFYKEYIDLVERVEYLGIENDILYKKNAELEESTQQMEQLVEISEELSQEYKNENETLSAEKQSLEIELKSLKSQMLQTQGKLMSRDITINSYKDKHKRCIIHEGDEEDLYPGEQKDIILLALQEKMSHLPKYTRQYTVLGSIIQANPEDGTRLLLKSKIIDIFRNRSSGSKIDSHMAQELNGIGFDILTSENHYRLVFKGDKRYAISTACTPSDPRNGMNTATDIIRMVL